MIRHSYIALLRALAVLLVLMGARVSAFAQTVVYAGETSTLSVVDDGLSYYEWDIYNDGTVDFAKVPGTAVADGDAVFIGSNQGATVNVQWINAGTYYFKCIATEKIVGCSSNFKIGIIEVKQNLPTAIIEAGLPVCAGEEIKLKVTLSGTGPWEFVYTDGTTDATVNVSNTSKTPPLVEHTITINPGPTVDTEYWIKQVKDKYGTNTAPSEKTKQLINPLPGPSLIYHR